MADRLCTTHADYYDIFYSAKEYEREVSFMIDTSGQEQGRVLIIGCGTGEHARHFDASGWEVVGIDASSQMLEIAASKCDATFERRTLPDIDIGGSFDLITLPGGVINYLPPSDLQETLQNARSRLSSHGTLLFDHPLPFLRDVNPPIQPWLEIHDESEGMYARAIQLESEDGQFVWNAIYFVQEDQFDFFVESHPFFVYTRSELAEFANDARLEIVHSDVFPTDQALPVYLLEQTTEP